MARRLRTKDFETTGTSGLENSRKKENYSLCISEQEKRIYIIVLFVEASAE